MSGGVRPIYTLVAMAKLNFGENLNAPKWPAHMTFRLRSKQLLLTYSQVDNDTCPRFYPERRLISNISQGLSDLLTYRCGHELHADGGDHFHVFVAWETPISTRHQDIFDFGSSHPNIQPIRRTPEKAFDYAGKDNDVIHEHGERPGESGASVVRRDDIWADALAQPTRDEFLQHLRDAAPRDYVLYFDQLERFADRFFAPPEPIYSSPDFTTLGFPGMADWLEQSRIGRDDRRGRVKSLVLWGPSLTGKTLWARSLGK